MWLLVAAVVSDVVVTLRNQQRPCKFVLVDVLKARPLVLVEEGDGWWVNPCKASGYTAQRQPKYGSCNLNIFHPPQRTPLPVSEITHFISPLHYLPGRQTWKADLLPPTYQRLEEITWPLFLHFPFSNAIKYSKVSSSSWWKTLQAKL